MTRSPPSRAAPPPGARAASRWRPRRRTWTLPVSSNLNGHTLAAPTPSERGDFTTEAQRGTKNSEEIQRMPTTKTRRARRKMKSEEDWIFFPFLLPFFVLFVSSWFNSFPLGVLGGEIPATGRPDC